MKTTLEINDVLHARAKTEAARRKIPLTRLVEEGLRLQLDGPVRSAKRQPFRIENRDFGMKPAFRAMSMTKLAAQLEDEAILGCQLPEKR